MVASLGFLVQEKFHPFFDGKITGPAIYHFQQANELRPYFWVTTCLMPGACYRCATTPVCTDVCL